MKRLTWQGEPLSMKALVVTTFVSLGGFIFGYDIGYISSCLVMPHFQRSYGVPDASSASGYSLSEGRQAVIVSLLSAGSFAGALLGVPLADITGRRSSIVIVSCIFMVGVIVQVAPYANREAFIAGRFIAGFGVGALSALVPLYQGEVSPRALRGAFTSMYQIMITIGILLAYCLDYATHSIDGVASFKIPIGLQLIWALALACGAPFLPKSPRESVLNGHRDNAVRVVASMHGMPEDNEMVQDVVTEIEEKIEEERHNSATYLDCFNFRSPLKTGQRTLIGMAIQSFQQLTGANFIFYYGTSIFQGINTSINSYQSQIIFGTLDVVGTIPGLWFLDRFGRRRTMITGAIVMGLSYMLYAVIGRYALYPNNDSTQTPYKSASAGYLFVVCVFVLAYGGSFGPGGWFAISDNNLRPNANTRRSRVNTGEVAPLRTKAKQLSFIAASNWTWNFLLSYFSPYIAGDIGNLYGMVFFGANFLAAAFIYFFLPEMSRLSLEEINTMFQQGVSARDSFKWNRELIANRETGRASRKQLSMANSKIDNYGSSPERDLEKAGKPYVQQEETTTATRDV